MPLCHSPMYRTSHLLLESRICWMLNANFIYVRPLIQQNLQHLHLPRFRSHDNRSNFLHMRPMFNQQSSHLHRYDFRNGCQDTCMFIH